MQVANVSYNTNHKISKQSFTGIKNVKCTGLYKKYPKLGKELVDTFKNNPKVMEFCKKYDVSVVFHAMKDNFDSAKASVCIFYDNIAKSKTKKLLNFFNGSDDKVIISLWGNNYNLDKSLLEATNNLKHAISPENPSAKCQTGLLNAHLVVADRKIQGILTHNAEVKQQKPNKISEKEILDTSIKDLIDKSK